MSTAPNTHHVVGTGPHHVLVLHGWFGDSHAFAPIESALTRSDFTYAFMDYRGYGGMRDVHGAFTMDEIAADALALADHLGFAQFSVVGHSMGGMAVQRMLSLAPDRVRKLVALTPVPASGVAFDAAGWALFSGAADNPHNRFAIIDYHDGKPAVAGVDHEHRRLLACARVARRDRSLPHGVGENRLQRDDPGHVATGEGDRRRARPGAERGGHAGDLPRALPGVRVGGDGERRSISDARNAGGARDEHRELPAPLNPPRRLQDQAPTARRIVAEIVCRDAS